MKKILIVKTNRDDFLKTREELIARSIKWSDEAIETNDAVYIVKQIDVPMPNIQAEDFTEIDVSSLISGYESLLKVLNSINTPKIAPKATESPRTNDSLKDDVDDLNELEKTDESASDVEFNSKSGVTTMSTK